MFGGSGWGWVGIFEIDMEATGIEEKNSSFFFAENRGVGGFFITLKALVNLYKQTQLGGRRHC